MWLSAYERAIQQDNLEVIWYIDDDDKNGIEQFHYMETQFYNHIKAVIGPRIVLSQTHNECLKEATGDIVAFIGDDVIFHTYGWDNMVRAEFDQVPDKILLVYGDDLLNKQSGVHAFVHRNWIAALGYLVPDYFDAFFADAFANEIAHNVGRRRFIKDMVMEHMHPSANKSIIDKTAQEMYARNAGNKNDIIWQNTISHRVESSKKLLEFINKFNDSNFELVNYERLI